tara:strand:+ start:1148 stop:1915 length:768 start_codon:yes stop_codon:yes gene_type:complete
MPYPRFIGWDMASRQNPPSLFNDDEGKEWQEDNNELINLLKKDLFIKTDFVGGKEAVIRYLPDLQWRHYIVQTSVARAYYAAKNHNQKLNLSEFGVADGLTAWFALNKLSRLCNNFQMTLYDAWSEMKEEQLLQGEVAIEGYSLLELEKTKRNLNKFSSNLCFIKGYIPYSLPKEVEKNLSRWIHIDLNFAKGTIDVLDKFFINSYQGSIALLDDYGHLGFEPTRKLVDEWVSKNKKEVSLEVFPSGQAIINKIN